ncbi:SusC/RagA family TonB-linked outer membrane protein [Chryseobacterium sp. Leaf404]|uniref:SusC/RagA family TonB-linked outer membrane protein n=1 Tax=unclassified Chryseobacterium TaxID=2593645 RepID=UPI0006FFDB2E|nr:MULTISPECIES: SusC/RagA family TonB-linked outer membrane protein [unclassified Chryseobacterium]KQT20832.1 SusC/RagA family TonB-linked outer membrane protein [Chryseobacterium sp. Leaf404]
MKNSYYKIGGIFFGLMLTAVSTNTKAQTRTISGTVTVANKTLSGVTISQEGSDQVTTTNENGTYTLQVSAENPILIFSHPDYTEQRISANNESVINVSLNSDTHVNEVKEVVLNAGYYKVKDKERTGSIAKISAKDIENQPITNVLSAAQGRMSGVSITQNGGTPGGGYQIRIRGQNSLRTLSNSGSDGNQPLYVVDGVPIGSEVTSQYSGSAIPLGNINPLNSISPQDIESLEILKDADATAIYGSRGANGVVLITTKKGKSGRLGLSFNTMYSMSTVSSNLEMMNSEQYINMRKQAFSNSGVSVYPATAYDVNGAWDQSRDTNWRKELIGNTATATNTQISLNGGSDTTTFLVSAGHQEQTTVYSKDYQYKTNNISSNLNHRSADSRFRITISNMFSTQKNNVIAEDITRRAYLLSPNAPALYNADGSLNWQNNTFSNPVAAYNGSYSNENLQFLNNFNTEYEIFKNLKLRLNGGINYQAFEEWALRPNTIYNPSFVTGQSSFYSNSSTYHQNKFSYIIEPQVNWNFQKGNHRFDILAGATYQSDDTTQGSLSGNGFESNAFIMNIAAAQTKTIGDHLTTEYRYGAVFGRVNYQLNKKYIVNITGRRDGSSRFGPNNKFANFGAVGAAWLFSEENFFKESKWLSSGKLRGSYGTSGSDNIGDFQYLNTYTVTSAAVYNGVTGLLPSRLYNPDFSWEKTTKLEMALELGLFKNRLNLTSSHYRNRSGNQLVGYQLSAVTGFSTVNANLDAVVENTGWEFDLNARPLTGTGLQWETGFNISFPKNKLISFPGLAGSTYANTYIIGQPVQIVRVYQLEGNNPQTGQYVFTDFNGDGKITSPDDRQVIENIGIRYFGGWNNQLKYKNWNMSFLFQFVKQKARNYNAVMPIPGSLNNLPVEALNVWSPSNPGGFYMPYVSVSNPSHTLLQNSDAAYSDASFIRLKNIQLSYKIPVGDKTVFKDARIFIQGQNLLTVTNYFGIDPETGSGSFLPPLKTYSFGVQLGF